jgi:hypothetical protein
MTKAQAQKRMRWLGNVQAELSQPFSDIGDWTPSWALHLKPADLKAVKRIAAAMETEMDECRAVAAGSC